MTIEATYALFRDKEMGSLPARKLPDPIILSDNPLTAEPDAIKDLEVWMPVVGRRVAHCTPGHETLCPGW